MTKKYIPLTAVQKHEALSAKDEDSRGVKIKY